MKFLGKIFNKFKNSKILNKSLVRYGLVLMFLAVILAVFLFPKNKINPDLVVNKTIIKQNTTITAGVGNISWSVLVNKSDISSSKYLIALPKNAQNIKINSISNKDTELFLNNRKLENSSLLQRKGIATDNSKDKFLPIALFNSVKKSLIASMEVVADLITDQADEKIQQIGDNMVVDLSSIVVEPEINTKIVPEEQIVVTETPTDIPTPTETSVQAVESSENPTEEVLQLETVTEIPEQQTTVEILPSLIETTTPTEESVLIDNQADLTKEVIKIDYEIPAPEIKEKETDTGKLVTIFSDVEIINAEGKEVPLTDVVAFTNIPEIYKVGQESKIKIKWKSEDNREVTFKAYDTDNNGKLDYVEWIVPHLSTQIFEIIFISKAFLLDNNKDIIEDIYDAVKTQDNNWVSITTGQYVRVTFEKILTNKNDITIYAKPTNPGHPVEIRAFTTDTNQLVADFFIDHEGMYKQLIPELSTPTDLFDLQVIGNVDIDYVVDPGDITTGLVAHYKMNDTSGTIIDDNIGVNDATTQYDLSGSTVPGKLGNALNFVSYSDFGTVTYNSDFDFSETHPFSISAWIYADTIYAAVSIINQFNLLDSGWSFYQAGSGLLNFYNNSYDFVTTNTFSENSWNHVVITHDGYGNYFLCLNDICEQKTEAVPYNNSANLLIGYEPRLGGSYSKGLDDLRIYNRVLSQEDVDALWNGGNGTEEDGVVSDTTALSISYTAGTPANNSFQNTNTVNIGVTTSDANGQHSVFTDWNNSLVGWWKLNGDATDSSGNGIDGTNNGTTATVGKFGQAMSFDGIGDYINLGNSQTINTAAITYNAWVKFNSFQNDYTSVISKDESIGTTTLLVKSNGTLACYTDGGNNYDGTGTHTLSVGNWYLLTMTYSPIDGIKGYVNGELDGSALVNGPLSTGLAEIWVGGHPNFGRYLDGSIDDVMIFNRALTIDEIKSLYDASANQYSNIFTGLSDGSYTFKSYAQDLAGNVTIGDTRTFSVDTTNPTISVTSPTNGSWYNGPVNFTVSTTDTNKGNIIPDLDNSLVGWWKLNGDVADSSGNGNSGTNNGATATAGKFGQAMSFDGVNNYVDLGNSSVLDIINQVTLHAWVKNSGDYSVYRPIIAKREAPGYELYLQKNTGYIGFYNGTEYTIPVTIPDNEWVDLTITAVSNGDLLFYVNGAKVGESAIGGINSTSGDVYIGLGSPSETTYLWDGSIDDVMIFNRALSAEEVASLYDGTSLNKNLTLTEGSYTYKAYAQDLAGNIAESSTATFTVDVTNPTSTISTPITGTYSTSATVSLTGTSADETNLSVTTISIDGGAFVATGGTAGSWTYSATSLSQGAHTFQSKATDSAGNTGLSSVVTVTVDNIAPNTATTLSWSESSPHDELIINASWVKSNSADLANQKIQFYTGSNCDTVSGSLINLASASTQTYAFTGSDQTTYTYKITSIDTATNETVSACSSVMEIVLDNVPPTTDINLNGYTSDTWTFSDVTAELTCQDTGSGCDKIYACTDSQSACDPTAGTAYNSPKQFTYTTEGITTLRWKSKDLNGNWQTVEDTAIIKIDKTAPVTTASAGNYVFGEINDRDVSVALSCDDNSGSGCANTYYCTDTNNSCNPITPYISGVRISVSQGLHTVYFRYYSIDNTLHSESVLSKTVKIFGAGGGSVYISGGEPEIIVTPIVPVVPQEPSIIDQLQEQVSNIAERISDLIAKQPEIIYPPISEAVPQEPQEAFKGVDVMTVDALSGFNITPVGNDISFFVDKLPQFEEVLKNLSIDVEKLDDIKKLTNAKLYLPGLTQIAYSLENKIEANNLTQGIPLAEFNVEALEKIPTNMIFASTAGGFIDYMSTLSVNDQGDVERKLSTIVGKPIDLVIKTEKPASRVTGFVILKNLASAEPKKNNIFRLFGASLVSSFSENENQDKKISGLLVNKFEYQEAKPGIFTANINSPALEGEYEIKTIVEYKDKSLAPTETRILAVVDPEGYIFQKIGKMEARVPDAKVTIYWQNPETKEYETWLADKFMQKNPIITDNTGKYSFLVPPGEYYLSVIADGYFDYRSENFTVTENNGVVMNIELKDKSILPAWLNWKTLTIILSILLIIFIVLIILKNKNINPLIK